MTILPGTGRWQAQPDGGGSPPGATRAGLPLYHSSNGPPPQAGEDFAAAAARLAGLAGALLGWRPDEFWSATPEELAVILQALSPPTMTPDARTLAHLQELFPDG